jgi:hypothetical protein
MPAGRSRDGPGQEAMGQQGCRLRAKVIPAAFPSGKTGHISGAMDVNLEWTRISDDRRPQAWKRGSPEPERGNQPEEPGPESRRRNGRCRGIHGKGNPVS